MKLYTQAITLDHHFTQKVVEIDTLGPIIHRNTCTDGVQPLVARACAPVFPTLATPLVKSVHGPCTLGAEASTVSPIYFS